MPMQRTPKPAVSADAGSGGGCRDESVVLPGDSPTIPEGPGNESVPDEEGEEGALLEQSEQSAPTSRKDYVAPVFSVKNDYVCENMGFAGFTDPPFAERAQPEQDLRDAQAWLACATDPAYNVTTQVGQKVMQEKLALAQNVLNRAINAMVMYQREFKPGRSESSESQSDSHPKKATIVGDAPFGSHVLLKDLRSIVQLVTSACQQGFGEHIPQQVLKGYNQVQSFLCEHQGCPR